MDKKVLVLGSSGFLGQNIVQNLKQDNEVYGIDEYSPLFIQPDKSSNESPYQNYNSFPFNICVHLIDHKVDLKEYLCEEEKLANNLNFSSASQMIVMSSSVLYANPNSEYAQRKAFLEKFWTEFSKKNNIKLTILRLFNVFGLYHIPYAQGGLIANMMYNSITGNVLTITDLKAKRDFVFAEDVAKIVRYAMENGIEGQYDIASGHQISIEEILDILNQKIMNKKCEIRPLNQPDGIICPMGSPELYQRIQKTMMTEALKKTYQFYLDNAQMIKVALERKKQP